MHQEKPEKAAKLSMDPVDVEAAKLRFRKAADEFSPLRIVRERPFSSVGVAFLAGFGLNALGTSRSVAPALATVNQITSLALQLAPLLISRARSSDG